MRRARQRNLRAASVLAAILVGGAAVAEDWPQWRGPNRDGIAPAGTPLAESWPEGGPKRVWESEEKILCQQLNGGFSSVSVVGGRAFLYEYRKSKSEAGEVASDVFYCLDAATGKTVWRREFDGQAIFANGCSSTVAVVDGRVYGMGGSSVYALNAADGAPLWQAPLAKQPTPWGNSSSPLVADGLVIVIAGQLTAYRVADGSRAWTQPAIRNSSSSPVLWKNGGRDYLLCGSEKEVACTDLADGRVRWTAPGGGHSTPAVSGDTLVQVNATKDLGLVAYRISPEKAEAIWSLAPFEDRGTSVVIHEGHVYAVGGWREWRALCARLADGRILWEEKSEAFRKHEVNTPILADGKLLFYTAETRNLVMIRAAPERYEPLAQAMVEPHKPPSFSNTGPTISDGRLYLRLNERVACYDLRP
jgi:outer membrane protein assembly factor BamB